MSLVPWLANGDQLTSPVRVIRVIAIGASRTEASDAHETLIPAADEPQRVGRWGASSP
jgi:hypothetical protein